MRHFSLFCWFAQMAKHAWKYWSGSCSVRPGPSHCEEHDTCFQHRSILHRPVLSLAALAVAGWAVNYTDLCSSHPILYIRLNKWLSVQYVWRYVSKKSSPKCCCCHKQVGVKCMSKLVKVCSSGCGCYSWACPSCQGKTTGLIANVNNTVMLRDLLNASQAKLKDLREIHDLDWVNNLYRLLKHSTQAKLSWPSDRPK